jgi:hypothetical protein
MFNFFEDNTVRTFPLHNYFNYNNNFSVPELKTLSLNSELYNSFPLSKFSFNIQITNKQLNDSFSSIFNELFYPTLHKNDVQELICIFPEKLNQLENFAFEGLELDESVYEVLSTPETKMYYPEPFIASPSFVHEDL